MAIYEISNFSGGLADFEDRGLKGAFKFGANLDIRKRRDTLSCNQTIKNEYLPSSAAFTNLLVKQVKCSDGYVYGFGHLGKIYKRDTTGAWTLVKDMAETITSAEEKPSAGGIRYLVWTTLTKLHCKRIPGVADWSDVDTGLASFPKTTLTNTSQHSMAVVAGDVMIANDSSLAMLAYDDSYTDNALDLIPGNIAKTVLERNGRAVVGTYRAGDPNKGVNGAIDSEVPLIQVGDDGELFYADFASTMPVKRFPGGGKVNPAGVCNLIDPVQLFNWETTALSWIDKQSVGNLAVFGVYGASTGMGGIYTYGRKSKNHPFVLNLEYQFDADEIGSVCSIGGVIVFSYRSGANYGVKAVDLSNKATGIYEGLDFKAPIKKASQSTIWGIVELFLDPLPTSCSVEFWYKLNKTGSFIQAKTADGNSSYAVTNGKQAVFRIQESGQILEPRIVLNSSGNTCPEVHRLRIYFN